MVSQSATRDADAYYRYYGRPDRITINQARKGEDIGPDREGGNPSGSRTSIQDVQGRPIGCFFMSLKALFEGSNSTHRGSVGFTMRPVLGRPAVSPCSPPIPPHLPALPKHSVVSQLAIGPPTDTLTRRCWAPRPQAVRKRWSGIISEGGSIDPRGLGTQLSSAASPYQVIKINA
jgi:hypothetical protein